jgi:hypothetical protein
MPATSEAAAPAALADAFTVWAVNVAGPAYRGVDGTAYEAESWVTGGRVGAMEIIKGSQDAPLYANYRSGDVLVNRAIPNGTYDVTFHFAEPEDVPGGARVFDAFVEDQRVIDDLDVMASRDGKVLLRPHRDRGRRSRSTTASSTFDSRPRPKSPC